MRRKREERNSPLARDAEELQELIGYFWVQSSHDLA